MANILVVDDELLVLNVLGSLLENLRHRVWKTGNARDALALLNGREHFDLAVIDLVLTGISGFDLIKQMREKNPSLPIIAISGYIDSKSINAKEALYNLGVRGILEKPPSPLELATTVTAMLGKTP